jgi:tRNA dimethylallyltransferase
MAVNLIAIIGPTASGKTALAVRLASEIGAEIISADSRQVYRGMNIGTGKELEAYRVGEKAIPYYLIDIVDPDYEFNAFEYQKRFVQCFSEINLRGIIPILVGGTGLYIESILKNYQMVEVPEDISLRNTLKKKDTPHLIKRLKKLNLTLHNTTDIVNRGRIIRAIEIAERSENTMHHPTKGPFIEPFVIGVHWNRAILRQRITHRLKQRLASGMIDEIKHLHQTGVSWERLNAFGLEYRYIGQYLQGKIIYDDMVDLLNTKIHQFAKRQDTWFRRMERQGIVIHWIEGNNYNALKKIVDDALAHEFRT